MNLAWKSLHVVLVLNEKENTQHLDQECVQKAKKGSWAVRDNSSMQLMSKYLSHKKSSDPPDHFPKNYRLKKENLSQF